MPLFTPEEVAAELKVSRRSVYEWLRTGKLHGLRAGGLWRIKQEDLDSFLASKGRDRTVHKPDRE